MAQKYQIGDRLSYDGALCTIRYIGEVAGTSGTWLGVEWDDPSRGKHDGHHKDVRYFTCRSKAQTVGSFVRPSRPADKPQGFVAALHRKYASEVTADQIPVHPGPEIVISGKVAEEVGFDKIRRKLAQVHELRIVILDGMRVASARPLPAEAGDATAQKPVREACPLITELDLSRNLFTRFTTVAEVCEQLGLLRVLKLNGNRFQGLLGDDSASNFQTAFKNVKELSVNETLMTWDEICHVAAHFPSLNALYAGTNQLSSLTPAPTALTRASMLTSLNLEYNDFASLADIAALGALTSLRNLHLKGNNISTITADPSGGQAIPVFGPGLQYLDLSYNRVVTWAFVDALPSSFPGLTSLRFTHNPVYENPAFDNAASSSTEAGGGGKATVTEEAYMITLARLPALQALNFSAASPADRTNAEMFYLSRIARQLAAVPKGAADEARVLAQHARWADLCALYGEPAVVRRREVNPAFLEARLVDVAFRFMGPISGGDPGMWIGGGGTNGGRLRETSEERRIQIPRSFDIYAVKGIAGRLFGHPPLRLRLVWETGEWDPVAGFDEEVGDSSEDEEMEEQQERAAGSSEEIAVGRGNVTVIQEGGGGSQQQSQGRQQQQQQQQDWKAGKWVKREVELKDGPRQLGFCVDGLEAKIRVEVQ